MLVKWYCLCGLSLKYVLYKKKSPYNLKYHTTTAADLKGCTFIKERLEHNFFEKKTSVDGCLCIYPSGSFVSSFGNTGILSSRQKVFSPLTRLTYYFNKKMTVQNAKK